MFNLLLCLLGLVIAHLFEETQVFCFLLKVFDHHLVHANLTPASYKISK